MPLLAVPAPMQPGGGEGAIAVSLGDLNGRSLGDAVAGSLEGHVAVGLGDDAVGEGLEGLLDLKSSSLGGVGLDALGRVLLAKDVIENNAKGARDLALGGDALRAEVDHGGLVDAAVGVVAEERVDAVLALLEGAVSTVVDRIALAAHGLVLVPEVVGVGLLDGEVEVVGASGAGSGGANRGGGGGVAGSGVKGLHLGELLDGLTGAVAGAVVGARGTDTGGTLVAVEAVAGAGLAVADALVGALHVEVTLVSVGVGVLLGGTPGVDLGASDDSGEGAGDHAVGVEVALGGVDVGDAEVAGALGAVVALVVLVAAARVLGATGAVAGAGVGALRGGEAEEREEDTGLHHRVS